MQPPPPPWRRRERELVLDDEAAERRAVRDALAALRRLRRGRGEALPLLGVAQRRGRRGVAVAAAAATDGGPEEPAPGLGGVGGAAHDLASEGAEAEVVEEAAGAHLAEVGGRRRGLASRPLLLGPLVEEEDAGAVDDVGLHAGDVHEALDVGHPDDVVVGGAPDLDGVVVAVGLRQAQRAQGARARARRGAVQAEHVALAAAVRVAVRPAVREEARRKQRLQPARPLPRVRRRGDLLLLLLLLLLLRLRVRAAAALHGQPRFRQLTRFARWRSI
jgi:hypothetical protein